MANYKILTEVSSEVSDNTKLVVAIDGATTLTLTNFYDTLAASLHFPDYFQHNLDSFDEVINDLDWIKENEVLIVFKNYDEFLTEENDEMREILLTILDDAASESKVKDDHVRIRFSIEPSELAVDDLETVGIDFTV